VPKAGLPQIKAKQNVLYAFQALSWTCKVKLFVSLAVKVALGSISARLFARSVSQALPIRKLVSSIVLIVHRAAMLAWLAQVSVRFVLLVASPPTKAAKIVNRAWQARIKTSSVSSLVCSALKESMLRPKEPKNVCSVRWACFVPTSTVQSQPLLAPCVQLGTSQRLLDRRLVHLVDQASPALRFTKTVRRVLLPT
jgi:hypothetical protein